MENSSSGVERTDDEMIIEITNRDVIIAFTSYIVGMLTIYLGYAVATCKWGEKNDRDTIKKNI